MCLLPLQDTSSVYKDSVRDALAEESDWLDTVYSTALYGGPTLSDSVADGAEDGASGSLFTKKVRWGMEPEKGGNKHVFGFCVERLCS